MNHRFCTECGSKVDIQHRMCTECGKPLKNNISSENAPSDKSINSKVKELKSNFVSLGSVINNTKSKLLVVKSFVQNLFSKVSEASKKTKIILAIIIILAFLLISGFIVGNILTSKDHLIDRFVEALDEKDQTILADILQSSDPNLEITEENITSLLSYLEDNPHEVSNIIYSIQQQSSYMDETKGTVEQWSDNSTSLSVITLSYNGKKGLLFNDYSLTLTPLYFELYSSYEGTKVFIDGNEVGEIIESNTPIIYGPLMPGDHLVKAVYNKENVELESEQEVSLLTMQEETYPVELYLEGEYVNVDLPYTTMGLTSKLYVDGKDRGIDLYEDNSFGPVNIDGSQKMYAEVFLPWGTVKTNEVPINSNEITLELDLATDENKNQIIETVHQYGQEWATAYGQLDSSYFKVLHQNYYEEVNEEINYSKEEGNRWAVQYLGAEVDQDSFKYNYYDDMYTANVIVNLRYKSDNYSIGEEIKLEESDNFWNIELVYQSDNKNWLVKSVSSEYGFESDNIKKLEAKDNKLEKLNDTTNTTTNSSSISEKEILDFMKSYATQTVASINAGDFSIAENFHDRDGKTYNEAKNYLSYLVDKGITEELEEINLVSYEKTERGYKIYMTEQYIIHYADGLTKRRAFDSSYTLTWDSNEKALKVFTLDSTKETFQEDI